jgi:DNA-binding NarL/FixJ family response regulator
MIALTNVDVISQVKQMLQKGCLGYLLKDVSPEILLKAIETVHNGEQFLKEEFKTQLLNSLSGNESNHLITRREKEILKLIVEENTNQDIAGKLFLSLRTVENHRNNLLQKLQVKNTAGLVKIAIQEGLI